MSAIEAATRCRTLVAGFGRPGTRDLDFGRQLVRYLEALSWDEGVIVEDLSYAAPLVLDRLRELDPAKVVLVGAVARGFDPPGFLRRWRLDLEPPSAQQVQRSLEDAVQGVVDIEHTLAVVRHYGALPAETVIIEVEPADCSFGPGFSEELAGSFDAIVELVLEEVGASGAELDVERSQPPSPNRRASQVSPELEALTRYAEQHAAARVVAPLRGSTLVAEDLSPLGLTMASRSRPWGVNTTNGGDWFDVVPLDDGWFGCVIGDVPGRGAEAAAAMGDLRAAVRAYAIADGRHPARVLGRLDQLARATGLGADATLAYVALRPATGEARLSNAGHVPPLLLRPDGRADCLRVAIADRLGLVARCGRPEEAVHIPGGATLLLFTDGLVRGRAITLTEGLARLASAASSGPADLEDLCDRIVDACVPNGRREDDACVLALRRVPAA